MKQPLAQFQNIVKHPSCSRYKEKACKYGEKLKVWFYFWINKNRLIKLRIRYIEAWRVLFFSQDTFTSSKIFGCSPTPSLYSVVPFACVERESYHQCCISSRLKINLHISWKEQETYVHQRRTPLTPYRVSHP